MPQITQIFNHKTLMRIAIIIAFIQFTNALEYMALTPVFSFMAEAFSVPVSFSGYVSGMYTLGSVISGVAAFYWVDRFDKKRFLIQNMLLLGTLTLVSTFTTNFDALLALRFCAGLVGGTTMGVGTSILINYSPVNMRGKMLATVIASFSMVSIVGMPAILYFCTHYGWHISLWSISFLCLLSLPLIAHFIPKDSAQSRAKNKLSIDAQTLLFASCNALVQFSPMLVIPILTPLMTHYLGAQQNQLPLLFLSGGIAGYLSTKITGVLTSRFSALMLSTISTLLFVLSLLIPAAGYHNAVLFITLFLGASYSRLVSSSSVSIQYPADEQRASFSSLQTAIMSLITTFAFFLSSLLLPDHGITTQNLDRLLVVCALAATGFPLMVMVLQKKLAKRIHQPDHVVIE
ncbi:MFS transporter [Klebsiella oxytoca]|uniref:MFS transporter n=1 Tax=Citrobacter braakii TaxID=57706 RepID=UPI00066C87A2|nr:MFS transporter [Citrobacter braakii]EGT0645012.1 MFS transporter [Citrobacter braakii]ELK0737108.1 MFS transporter [Klebsiella oxytoca]HEI9715031.1 MFS transporter [Klebsiella oxytoca]HEI9787272.1 MFS transporter [Klebsiella oxytoca]